MNLYIFNETSRAATFGIGTYIRELTTALRHTKINICVVNLKSDKSNMQIEKTNDVMHWYIPEPIQKPLTIEPQKQRELYYHNVVYLLKLYIKDKNDLIFHLNYLECKPLADYLKIAFDCKIVLVVHALNSVTNLLGNISLFRKIISQTLEQTEGKEKLSKKFFQKEKELFQSQSIDKIICLSYHTFELLHREYQIEKEKLVVIYNGLSDAYGK